MLVTEDRHAYTSFPFSQAPGSKIWRAVSLEMRIPYFFVDYAIREGELWLSQVSILWKEEDLLDFCRENHGTPSTRIIQIALLAPPGTDGIDTWRMITLKEIWRGKIRDQQHHEMVYVGMDGEKLLSPLVSCDVSQIELLERLYPVTMPVAQAPEKPKAGRTRRQAAKAC